MSAAPTSPGSSATPESPWLGLRSFTEDAQPFFFGRSEELDDLYERILDKSLAILFGQSGLGKSSLLQAALIPRLRSAGLLPVFIRFDHDADAPTLEYQLLDRLRAALESAGYVRQATTVRTALANRQGSGEFSHFLWLLFHDPALGLIPQRGTPNENFPRPVFLIDQFEEIFTLGERPARRYTSTAFRETLASLVENRPPASLRAMLEEDDDLVERLDYKAQHVKVLLSLREDFLHMLERWRRSLPSVMENRFELRMLGGTQAFLAVVRPGELRPDKPAIIPETVGEAIVRFVAAAQEGVPLHEIDAVPPLLSLVCAELNAQRLDAGNDQITQAQFEGHSDDILSSFYLRSFDLATYGSTLEGVPRAAAALKNMRRLIEDRLLSPDGFRESIALDTIARELSQTAGPDVSRAILDGLVLRRLLTVEERGGVRRIELAHDVLTRIVRVSRDERHEAEAVLRARSEKERAEAETARILKERNRLQRFAILASGLAIIAAGGALLGFVGLQRSEEAKRQALEAKNQAVNARNEAIDAEQKAVDARNQALESEKKALESRNEAVAARNAAQRGFDSAWTGLTTLYDDYAAGTLENTPGISGSQANKLKSKLRGHLLEQLQKLNQEHPDHRGTIHYIARLLLDEGREAIEDGEYTRASDRLNEALQSFGKRPLETAPEAELYAEILLEEARIPSNAGDPTAGAQVATKHLPTVAALVETWPDSWRLDYLMVRLENVRNRGDGENRQTYATLAERLLPLIEKSGRHFDPVAWHFIITTNSYRAKEGFHRTAADYESLRDLIVWFRENTLQATPYTLVQLEYIAETFDNFLQFISGQFEAANDESTEDLRRSILNELETTMKAIETRLPSNKVAYSARGALLHLQELCVEKGINTRSPEELQAAAEKHRMVSSALGVASSVADSLAPAFTSYASGVATQSDKDSALLTIRNSLQDYLSLDLTGADVVLENNEIRISSSVLQRLDGDDPAASLYEQMVDRYLQLHRQASRDSRPAFVETIARISAPRVEKWYAAEQFDKIAEFWDSQCAEIPIKTLSSGDKETLIRLLKLCGISLVHSGRDQDAQLLLSDTYSLSQNILAERPWEFYVRDAMTGLCFEAAKALGERGDSKSTQEWLRRGWEANKEYVGAEIDLSRYPELPFKGDVPENIPEADAAFFARFRSLADGGARLVKLTLRAEFTGKSYPFNVYIISGKNGYTRLLDQFRWLSDVRGGSIARQTQEVFERISREAIQRNLDFSELCKQNYAKIALNAAETQLQAALDAAAKEPQAAQAVADAQPDKEAPLEEMGDREQAVTLAYAAVCRAAIDCYSWENLEHYAKDWDERNPFDVSAQSKLAIARFAQGFVLDAVSIYKDLESIDGARKIVGADIESLTETEGVVASLKRLHRIAVEHEVSFPDLVEYALSEAIKAQKSLEGALEEIERAEQAYEKEKTDANRQGLSDAYNAAANAGLYWKRWSDVETWARKAVDLNLGTDHTPNVNLATALLFQGEYDQALAIYQKYWRDSWEDKTIGDAVLEDFEQLEKIGITHPDVSRIRDVLGTKPETDPSNAKKE
jgi:hypothetical protein